MPGYTPLMKGIQVKFYGERRGVIDILPLLIRKMKQKITHPKWYCYKLEKMSWTKKLNLITLVKEIGIFKIFPPVIESTDSEEEMTECYRQTAKDSNNIKTKISKILQGSKSNQPEPPINNQQDE